MNVSAVTLRLLLIITAYMDDLLHEDTNIFFLSITRIFFLVPNFRIFEFLSSHGVSRIVTVFLLYPEFSNYRILSSHGISRTVTDFLFSCPEFSRLVLGPTDPREVIIEFSSSMILRDSPCD